MTKKPNVLFLVIDSCRIDVFLDALKNSRIPNIKKISNDGLLFENTISCADGTFLSIGSVFTGAYPFKTGIGGKSFNVFNPSIKSFIKILKENGYQAFATLPRPMISFGLGSDFDNKDIEYDVFDRLEVGLGEKVLEKIDTIKNSEPWFYYIHLLDLHQPVFLPEKFNQEKFGDSRYSRMFASIDEWFGKIIDKIDSKNTILIITADHGEYVPFIKKDNKIISFEEVGTQKIQSKFAKFLPANSNIKQKLSITVERIRKEGRIRKIKNLELSPYEKRSLLNTRSEKESFLYDELIKVPLIFGGAVIPKKNVIKNLVRTIDIFPTLLDYLDLEDPEKKNRQGKNLKKMIESGQFEELYAYIESTALVKKFKGDVIGIRTKDYKYFRSHLDSKKNIHLYNIENDVLEESNISKIHPEIVQKMEQKLQNILELKENVDEKEMNETETRKVEEELRKLGYI